MTRNLTLNFEGNGSIWTGCNSPCGLTEHAELEHLEPDDFYCVFHALAQGNLYFCAHPDVFKFTDGSLKLCMVRAGKMKDKVIELVKNGSVRVSQ